MRRIVRIGGRPREHASEFGSDGLAKDYGAGRARDRDTGGITGRSVALVDRRAHLGRQIERVDHVLDADWHAMQRTAPWAAIERTRLRECMIGVDGGPGLDRVFARLDALEAVARHRFGGEFPSRYAFGDFSAVEFVE